jgi:hypothetical protein
MGRWTCAIALAIVGAGFVACGSGSATATDEGRADMIDVADVGDPGPDVPNPQDPGTDPAVGDPGDVPAEAGDEGPGDPGTLEIPYFPPKPATPAKDEPYIQDFNHTTNEVDPQLKPLVAVMARTAGLPAGEGPLQVTTRGVAWSLDAGTWTFKGPAEGEADLIGAAGGSRFVAMASPSTLYRVGEDGTVTKDPAPDGVTILGLDGGMLTILRTDVGVAVLTSDEPVSWPSGGAPVTAVTNINGLFYLGHPDGTVTLHDLLRDGAAAPAIATLGPSEGLKAGPVLAFVAGVSLPRAIDLVVVSGGGIAGLRVLEGGGKVAEPVADPLFAADRVPLDGPRAAMRAGDGGFVVATSGGAYRVVDRGQGPEWRVYGAERWLPSEDVRGLFTDASSDLAPLYFATAGGLATVTAQRMTVEQKMVAYVDRVVARHDRDGAVADSHLTRRGDVTSNIAWDSDNDGSWSAYWLMSECARWKVTGDLAAKAHFDKTLDAMLFLRTVTGTDWFIARAVIRKEGCLLNDCDNPDDGLWFTSADGKWWVKRDTSNDEIIAHISMLAFAHEFCADADQQQRIATHMSGLMGGIIDHGYQLWDPITMEVTTYGQLDPEYVNVWIGGAYGDGGLRAAILLSGLTTTYWMTGDERFAEAKRFLIEENGYADAADTEILHEVRPLSNDNDEMSSWAWWTLLRYETDPALRTRWEKGWSGVWDVKLKMQQAGWWGVARAVTGFTDTDLDVDVLRWLRLAPVDMIRWDQHNSHRKDIVQVQKPFDGKGGGMRTDGRPLPYDERRTDRFNTDQYRLDGGMGAMYEQDGAEVLMVYWKARLFGLIEPVN